MKWVNHIAIGAAVGALVNPMSVPAAVLGATAPDWLETVYKLLAQRKIKHRGPTHVVAYWLIALGGFIVVWDWQGMGMMFCVGGLTHLFGDAMTREGVPLWWGARANSHLFAGRLRTGGSGEYFVSFSVLVLCLAVSFYYKPGGGGFIPFFYEWGRYYDRGLIDGSEWKQNRWKFI